MTETNSASLMSDYLRSSPQMVRALEQRDIGAVFDLLHRRGGVTLRALGAAVGMTASRVQEIARGQRKVTSIEVLERIADALRVPGVQLGLAARAWEATEPDTVSTSAFIRQTSVAITDPTLPWAWQPAPTVEAIYAITRSDLMLDRRHALKTASVTAGLPLIDPIQRWLTSTIALPGAASGYSSRLGEEDLAQLESAAEIFRSWEASGGAVARKAVIGQLSQVAELLREQHPADTTKRLFHLMACLAKTAATMSWDCGLQATAQKYYVLALQVVRPTGDAALGANILASMARQLLYLGRPGDALELVRLAQDGSRHTATPRVKAMLATREAWAYANLGRIEAFRRATATAQDLYNTARPDDEDPNWISYFTEAELAGVTAGRLLDLAMRDTRYVPEGLDRVQQALDMRDPAQLRSRTLDQTGLAQLHYLHGDLDQAVAAGHDAAETAARTTSDRVRVQLRELYTQTASRRHVPAVAGLREHLHQTLAA